MTLDPADFQSVRRALDTSLTKATLPDPVIGDAIYKARAESFVNGRLPSATNDDPHAKLAVIYMTAAYLVYAVPRIVSESLPGASYTRQNTTPEADVARLESMATSEIDLSLNGGSPSQAAATSIPSIFGVAPGRRGN